MKCAPLIFCRMERQLCVSLGIFRLYNNHNQDINTAFKCHHVVFDTDATQRYKQYTPGLCFKLILFYARSWYSIYPRTFYITGILTSMWELIFFFILIWNEEITNAGIPFEEIRLNDIYENAVITKWKYCFRTFSQGKQ